MRDIGLKIKGCCRFYTVIGISSDYRSDYVIGVYPAKTREEALVKAIKENKGLLHGLKLVVK